MNNEGYRQAKILHMIALIELTPVQMVCILEKKYLHIL